MNAVLPPPAGTSAMTPGHTHPVIVRRFGLKGPGAPAWLARRGIDVPASPNCISRWHQGRCLRLGHGEFLVECDDQPDTPDSMPSRAAPEALPEDHDTWLLLRSDHCVLLDATFWPGVFAQACSYDIARLRAEPDTVVMTLFAGISVTLVPEPSPGNVDLPALRLWCDASYALYLDTCLRQLALPDPLDGDPA